MDLRVSILPLRAWLRKGSGVREVGLAGVKCQGLLQVRCNRSWWQTGLGKWQVRSGDGGEVLSPKNKLEEGTRGVVVKS